MKLSLFPFGIGCVLICTAAVIIATRNDKPEQNADSAVPTNSHTRHPRPAKGVSPSRLIASTRQHTNSSRDSWARSLDDAELKRLTHSMIAAYQDQKTHARNDTVLWMVPLAMEWGRRDIDGFFAEIKPEDVTFPLDGTTEFSLDQYILDLALRATALAGLSEDDPENAWQLLDREGRTASAVAIPRSPVESLAIETIFKNWTKQDPEAAWLKISEGDGLQGDILESGIRGLLASTSDPKRRDEIANWIAERCKPTQPSTAGDAETDRNSIDSILNNPNRNDPQNLITSAALGLAEHDPEMAWAWLQSVEPEHRPLSDIPILDRLFPSSAITGFLSKWAEREPLEAAKFIENHSEELVVRHRLETATALFAQEPESALDVLAGIPDPKVRRDAVGKWIKAAKNPSPESMWPLAEGIPQALSRTEFNRRVMENLERLLLPEAETEALRLQFEQAVAAPDS